MRVGKASAILSATAFLAAVSLLLGLASGRPLASAGGSLVLVYALPRMVRAGRDAGKSRPGSTDPPGARVPDGRDANVESPASRSSAPTLDSAPPSDADRFVETMLAQGRCALLLRAQIALGLSEDQFGRALERLREATALVPEGEVLLGPLDDPADSGAPSADEGVDRADRLVRLEPFFLDRYPVTNAQFHDFVAGGGYQEAALWDAAILPAVIGFVDRTGQPGPRFWSQGRYDPGKEDHPVVGVNWYEAAAYARWAGKRLPTDAEWVKAASWPVSLASPTSPRIILGSQRRYPWGDIMDRSRANLWGSGSKGTAAVTAFEGGASLGNVHQLIGNVWEWMRGDFSLGGPGEEELIVATPMKSIRGGAFDTYFDKQATCQFQSGEAAIARKHNIGFRCAVGVCDLVLARGGGDAAASRPSCATRPSKETPA